MSKSIKKTSDYVNSLPVEAAFSPLAVRSVLWRSRYLGKSEFIHHLPLAFWLAEVSRPTLVVQAAMEDPQCYFAFCQAVDKLNLPARCLGFGAWASDDKKGAPPKALKRHNEDHYADFSRIENVGLGDVARRLGRRRADLLIADLSGKEFDEQALIDLCETRMSHRGCALFYGVNAIHGDPGRSAFLNRLCEQHQAVWFDDHAGVVIVLIGNEQSDRLLQLAGLNEESPEYYNIQTVFNRLGSGHYYEWLSREQTAEVKVAQASVTEIKGQLKAKMQELDALTQAYDERDQVASDAQVSLFDLTQEMESRQSELETARDQLKAEMSDLSGKLAAARTERDEVQAALQATRTELEALADRNAKAEVFHDTARNERDAIARKLTEQQAAAEAMTSRVQAAEQDVADLRVTLAEAEGARAKIKETLKAQQERTEALTQDLEARVAEAETLRTALQSAEEAQAKSGDTLEAQRSQIVEQAKQLETRDAEVGELQATLTEVQEARASLEAALQDAQAGFETRIQELEVAAARAEELQSALQAAESAGQQADQAVQAQQERAELLQQRLDEAQEEREALLEAATRSTQRQATLEAELEQAQSEAALALSEVTKQKQVADQVQTLQTDLAAAEDQFVSAQIALERARKERDAIREERDQTLTAQAEMRGQLEEAARGREELAEAERSLKERLTEMEARALASEAALADSQATVASQNEKLADVTHDAAAVTKALGHERSLRFEETASLTRKLEDMREAGMTAQADVDAKVAELLRLGTEGEKQRVELIRVREAAEARATELRQIRAGIDQRESAHAAELEAIKREYKTATTRLADLEAELSNQRDLGPVVEQEAHFRETAALTKTLMEIEASASVEIAELKQEKVELDKVHRELFDRYNALLAESLNAEQVYGQDKILEIEAAAQKEREARFNETRALTLEIETLMARIQESSEGAAALELERDALRADLNVASEAEKKLSADRDSASQSAARLQEEVGTLRQTAQTRMQERDAAQQSIAKLQSELAALRNTAETQKREAGQAKGTADKALTELRGELAWRKRTFEEQSKRFEIQLRLREWQLAEQMSGGRLSTLRRDGDLKQRVQQIEASPHFDADWYMQTYPDVASYSKSPAEHYAQFGLYEGRNPGPSFDTITYYMIHPEALTEQVNAVVHASRKKAAS